ncbi:hypothetical protein AAE478_007274, partial [Parahypoxylon ruwenzoriense]
MLPRSILWLAIANGLWKYSDSINRTILSLQELLLAARLLPIQVKSIAVEISYWIDP